jgi:hypothetical protein
MNCSTTKCMNEAVTELRLRYQREDGTESEAVWEALCAVHARYASEGWLPVHGLVRGDRRLAAHEER